MAVLLAVGALRLGQGAYLSAKAEFAQVLIQRAWQRGDGGAMGGAPARPWPWADTHPVARLTSDKTDDELFVLAGASGRTLAFGPGHLEASVRPGEPGNSVLIGHRDTHFRFLERVEPGDLLTIDRDDGLRYSFAVTSVDVVDVRRATITLDTEAPHLTLVTCYPFDALTAGGPQRYVVSARLVQSAAMAGGDQPPSL